MADKQLPYLVYSKKEESTTPVRKSSSSECETVPV